MTVGLRSFETELNPGQWKVGLSNNKDMRYWQVDKVYLKGLRNRPWPLRKVDVTEFATRIPVDENGKFMEAANVIHGLPVIYYQAGFLMYLWPAPRHRWTLRVEMKHDG